jgi:GT2 family glycosyltransferase
VDEARGQNKLKFAAVAIGRNEGERLKRCLESLSTAARVVYVDSSSVDGSAQWARDHGLEVIELDMSVPFTAARARNAGFRALHEKSPDVPYVQFVDADCELRPTWPGRALAFLEAHSDVAVVCGRRRERYPEKSVYNWLCDREWDTPVGEVRACGGDAMMRVKAVEAVGGYRDDIIAGEEPELCVRLRAAGWHIWRLPEEMTLHDAAMTHFGQWWRRNVRSGYAYALGSYLHGASPERHWVWESRRAWLWGILIPVVCLVLGLFLGPGGWAFLLIFPMQVIRQVLRNNGRISERLGVAVFELLGRFPEAWGQIRFARDQLFGHNSRLIEYKRPQSPELQSADQPAQSLLGSTKK